LHEGVPRNQRRRHLRERTEAPAATMPSAKTGGIDASFNGVWKRAGDRKVARRARSTVYAGDPLPAPTGSSSADLRYLTADGGGWDH
jgi:hypothetical protein